MVFEVRRAGTDRGVERARGVARQREGSRTGAKFAEAVLAASAKAPNAEFSLPWCCSGRAHGSRRRSCSCRWCWRGARPPNSSVVAAGGVGVEGLVAEGGVGRAHGIGSERESPEAGVAGAGRRRAAGAHPDEGVARPRRVHEQRAVARDVAGGLVDAQALDRAGAGSGPRTRAPTPSVAVTSAADALEAKATGTAQEASARRNSCMEDPPGVARARDSCRSSRDHHVPGRATSAMGGDVARSELAREMRWP